MRFEAIRCERRAAVRVLFRHGAGIAPEYREKCLFHVRADLGPLVGAIWDPLSGEWCGNEPGGRW